MVMPAVADCDKVVVTAMQSTSQPLSAHPNSARTAINVAASIAAYRQRALVALQMAFLVAAGIGLALFHETPTVAIATAGSMLLSMASLTLAYQFRLAPAIWILATQFLLLPCGLALGALGLYDSGMLILPAGMVAIAIVEKPERVAIFSLLTVGAASFVVYQTLAGDIGHPLPADLLRSAPIDGVTALIVLIFCGGVATYIAHILSALLRVLGHQQSELEHKVARRTAQLSRTNEELRATMATLDRAKDELVRGEKLASLGSLVAGVAHELNTPIGNATVAATTVQQHIEEFTPKMAQGALRRSDIDRFLAACQEGVELVVRSLNRSRDLVSSFKQVAVDQASERRRSFLLNELTGDVLRTLRPGLAGHAWVIEEQVAADIDCDGYPGPLGQIITNLIQNALLHGFRDRTTGTIRIEGAMLDAQQMCIRVRDNGCGIPPESLSKIFDPFFTTRLGQGGSGLGLTICHNIATSLLGGRIDVESTVGVGTCFTLTLPRVAPLSDS